MSNLENAKNEEMLAELFDESRWDDIDLWNALAYVTLDGLDYYRYCKEDAWDLVDFDAIFERILEEFYNCDGATMCVRALATKAYKLERL